MLFKEWMDQILNMWDFIGEALLPVAGALITWSETRDAWREKRIRDFGAASDFTPEDRGEYADVCLDLYRNQYTEEVEQGEVIVRHLIYPRSWVQRPDRDDFMHLTDLPVEISDTKWDRHPPFAWFLPYPREGYAANKKDVQAGRSLLFNGRLFALESVRGDVSEGTLAVTVKNGGYFDFLNTCEYLVYEMAHARRVRRKQPPSWLHAFCGLPNRVRQADILDLSNRFAGIGVNTATLLYNVELEGGVKGSFILMHQRSGRVAEGIGALHVIPAGSYQPVGLSVKTDFNADMANTVYREFGEELLGVEEFFHLGDEEVLDPQYRRWDVLLLGMGIEPLNTKIEVLTAIRVDLDNPQNRDMFGGARSLDDLRLFFRTNYEGSLILVPLKKPNLRQYQRDPRTTPPGKEILSILLEHGDYFGVQ